MALLLINTAVLALIVLFILRLHRKHGSFLQFGVLFAGQLAINYPLRILLLNTFPNASKPAYPGLTAYDTLLHLSTLETGGILAFCAVYYLVDSRSRHHAILNRSAIKVQRSDVGIIAVVFCVSVLGIAYKIATGDYISFLIGQNKNLALANIVDNLVMMGWIPFAAAWYLFFAHLLRQPARWLLFGITNLVILPYQIIQGSKTFLLLPILIIMVTYYYLRGRLPIVGLALSFCFAAFFVFPFVAGFRDYINSSYGTIPAFDQFDAQRAVSDVYRETGAQNISAGEKFLEMLQRFNGADELYNMEHLVPKYMPYKHARDLIAVPLGLIPRAIWPSKPIFSAGAEYGSALGTITSVTPFPLGEMFWNFGKLGILLGMAVWGVVLALLMKLFDWLCRYAELRFFLVCCYLTQIYWMTTGEMSLAMLLASLPKQVIIYGGVYYVGRIVIQRKRRNARIPHRTARSYAGTPVKWGNGGKCQLRRESQVVR